MDPSGKDSLGAIRYNEEVIKAIITMAMTEVEGIAGVESRSTGNILSRKSDSRINKISLEEKNLTVDLSISVKYGQSLQDVAKNAQSKVHEKIEAMTDLTVNAINVNVTALEIEE